MLKHKPIGNLAKTGKPYAVKVARTVWKQGKTREGSTYVYGMQEKRNLHDFLRTRIRIIEPATKGD